MRAILLPGFAASLSLSSPAVLAQNPKLIEATKQEGGKVTVYTATETFTADAIKKAFEAKTGALDRDAGHEETRGDPA